MDNMELTLTIEEEPQATLNLGVAEGATDEASARTAEAYAKGTRNGVPVEEGDPAYHNNARYYRDSAAAIAAGDVIDDNAGAGDYNLTWSADKLTSQKADIEELESSKADAIEVTDSTPASVMSFSDGGNGYPLSATFEIAPVQDLHGYDNPWPGGGGKNALDVSGFETKTHNGVTFTQNNDGTISASGTASSSSRPLVAIGVVQTAGTYILNGCPSGGSSSAYSMDIRRSGSTLEGSNDYGSGSSAVALEVGDEVYIRIEKSYAISGTIKFYPMIRLSTVSDSTFAPYRNLCPITGWTGCNVSKAKKNLFDKTAITENYYINSSGELVSSVSWTVSDYIPVNAGGSVAYKGLTSVGSAPYSAFFDKNKRFISSFKQATGENSQSAPAGARYVRFSINYSANELNAFIVCTGLSVGDYEAYSATTYPISFPAGAGTVYGGTLTVNKDGTGKLVVDHGECDMGDLTWDSNTTYNYFTAAISDRKVASLDLKCSLYKTASASGQSNLNNGEISSTSNNNKIITRDNRYSYSDLQTYTEAMSGVQLVYELASPVEYTLTATDVGQILSLLGTNNLFCDTGDVLSVDYSADTKLYVDGKISDGMKLIALLLTANHEDGMKASKAYASGDLLTVGNTLYKATTSIANGATITAGTNVTETTIATELAALA